MIPHTESYEHLGEVMTHVQDMHPVWERERTRQRIAVEPEDALLAIEHDFPLKQQVLWDYLTKAENRAILMDIESMRVTGRSEVESQEVV